MVKTLEGTLLTAGGIILGILSVGCGGAIDNATDWFSALFYVGLSILLLVGALVMCAIGMSFENEYVERQNRKINRVVYHTNEWRNAE